MTRRPQQLLGVQVRGFGVSSACWRLSLLLLSFSGVSGHTVRTAGNAKGSSIGRSHFRMSVDGAKRLLQQRQSEALSQVQSQVAGFEKALRERFHEARGPNLDVQKVYKGYL